MNQKETLWTFFKWSICGVTVQRWGDKTQWHITEANIYNNAVLMKPEEETRTQRVQISVIINILWRFSTRNTSLLSRNEFFVDLHVSDYHAVQKCPPQWTSALALISLSFGLRALHQNSATFFFLLMLTFSFQMLKIWLNVLLVFAAPHCCCESG